MPEEDFRPLRKKGIAFPFFHYIYPLQAQHTPLHGMPGSKALCPLLHWLKQSYAEGLASNRIHILDKQNVPFYKNRTAGLPQQIMLSSEHHRLQ